MVLSQDGVSTWDSYHAARRAVGHAGIRVLKRRWWPNAYDNRLDIILVGLSLVGLAVAELDHWHSERDLQRAHHEVRTLGLVLTVNFTAPWKGGLQAPDSSKWISFGGGTRVCTAGFGLHSGKTVKVEFHEAEDMKFTPSESGTTTLSYFTSAAPGSNVYGLKVAMTH